MMKAARLASKLRILRVLGVGELQSLHLNLDSFLMSIVSSLHFASKLHLVGSSSRILCFLGGKFAAVDWFLHFISKCMLCVLVIEFTGLMYESCSLF
uniref:Uncharacterized protein n=1 Tax=Arundo donax TaxID=35708 RepID=A0A0A9DQT7_ARUDO